MKTFRVPVDFSAVTDQVIDAALVFARAMQGQVVLLHVIQPPVVAGGGYALPAVILDEAAKHHADFVIMGSHGHGKLHDFLVGSTASGLIKQAGCGVIVIPPPDRTG